MVLSYFAAVGLVVKKSAGLISQVLPPPEEVALHIMERRKDVLNSLRSTTTGLDYLLGRTIPVRVAFHRKL